MSKQNFVANVKKYNRNFFFAQNNANSTSRARRVEVNHKPIIIYQNEKKQECGDTYCTNFPNYPSDVIASLNTELLKFAYIFGDDFEDTVSLRFDADESGLCQSRRRLIHPQRGQTRQNTWLTIVNDEKYRQGITVEECQ